ncbi:MAG: hypothetical protein ABIA47_04475 [bacterium]
MNPKHPYNENPVEREAQREKESYQKALDFLYKTLGLPVDELDQFPQHLFSEIEKLERYKEIMFKVKELPKSEVPLAVFNLIKKGADNPKPEPKGNGVLLDSMRTGDLECAGRSMIVSQIFKNLGVEHAVAIPYGHSMILCEADDDTLVYFDSNNDLYFTFPKEALKGYKGLGDMAECNLMDYAPRDKDFYFGKNGAMRNMMVLPPEEGVLHGYLGNAGAALDGSPEFENDNIPVDKSAADAFREIRGQLLKEFTVPDSFYEKGQGEEKRQREKSKEEALRIFKKSLNAEEFADQILKVDELWKGFPYLEGEDAKRNIAGEWYRKLGAGAANKTQDS